MGPVAAVAVDSWHRKVVEVAAAAAGLVVADDGDDADVEDDYADGVAGIADFAAFLAWEVAVVVDLDSSCWFVGVWALEA